MTSPSKAKGNSFERKVADFLTELYGEKFIRVPGSGAYVGGKNNQRKQVLHEGQIRNFKGDIVPGQSFPRMNVECKSYKDFPFNLVYTKECKILEGWLDQLMDVHDPGDLDILFMKFNRKGEYVVVSHAWVDIEQANYTVYRSVKHGTWYIQEFDAFWKQNKDLVKEHCA